MRIVVIVLLQIFGEYNVDYKVYGAISFRIVSPDLKMKLGRMLFTL